MHKTPMAGTLHLLTGSTGAGKTTYARRLAAELGALVFSVDAWMAALFWPDSPQPIDPAWAIERVRRCTDLIRSTAFAAATAGTPCILEAGLTTRAAREEWVAAARAAGLPVRLHFLDVPAAERWRRTEARNAAGGELAFPITRELFDYVEAMWEPPTAAEVAAADGIRVDG